MNFELNDEQRMLKDSLTRFLADRYTFEDRLMISEKGFDPDIWRVYGELGLLGLPFFEADGGLGGGAEEIMIVMEAFGGALALEPYLSTCVIGAALLNACATTEQKSDLVPQIAEGTLTLAFAHSEPDGWYIPDQISTVATPEGEGWRLDGAKSLVMHGDSAEKLLVSATIAGEAPEDAALFLVDADAPGVTRRGYATQDGMRAAEITFSGAPLPTGSRLAAASDTSEAVRAAIDQATAATCAEAVGTMDRALQITVEYLKTRTQFGTPIGKFQVLQHRAADMLLAVEQARSMAMYATMMCRHSDAGERERAISAAKIQIGRSARLVGQEAVQLHGGVGMTMELPIGHYFKRLTMIEKAFGDTDFHIERLGAVGGLTA